MNQIVIMLGSNIEKERNLPAGVQLLRQLCRVIAVSPVYETVPVGLREQPNFFNMAAIIESDLDPAGVKEQVLAVIESRLNRVRRKDKNAPRTFDADIILFNNEVIDWTENRHLPDPDLLKFPHIAVPVADLLPHQQHPETGERLTALASRLLAKANAQNDGRPVLWPRPDIDALIKRNHCDH